MHRFSSQSSSRQLDPEQQNQEWSNIKRQSQERRSLSQHKFAPHPTCEDFAALAQHVAAAPQETLHSALWPQRNQVAQSLRQMGQQPEQDAHLAAYQALRLLVW